MKIFVSWSGATSQKVACAFRDWIPCVLQYVRPYVSSEDIDKGTRWSTEIATELNDSTYGILCVTADNQGAPWLNFEAGALSKAIDKSFVSPFLLNLKASELRSGPLIQFQATTYSQEEVRKLVESINNKAADSERVEIATVKRTFEKWWPELEKELQIIVAGAAAGTKPLPTPTKQEAMLEELLDLSRSQQRHLANPEQVLPPQYIEWALRRADRDRQNAPLLGRKFHSVLVKLVESVEELEPSDLKERIVTMSRDLHHLYHQSEERSAPSPRRKVITAFEDTREADISKGSHGL